MFYYFAFGSNLLEQRLRLNNKSAVRVGVGLLKGYLLSFAGASKTWHGSVATIIPSSSDEVWGAVWTMDDKDLVTLDSQESAPKLYSAVELAVELYTDTVKHFVDCRTYIMNSDDRGLPSPFYLDVIIRGAVQSKLPVSYIKKLKSFPHNGCLEKCAIYDDLLACIDYPDKYLYQVKDLKDVKY